MHVDFFISLLYGHLLVAAAILVAGFAGHAWPAAVLVGLVLLSVVWYRAAVLATDEWAGAVRAMINLGRRPLAAGMGLSLPQRPEQERAMWSAACEFVEAAGPGGQLLDAYRAAADGPTTATTATTATPASEAAPTDRPA